MISKINISPAVDWNHRWTNNKMRRYPRGYSGRRIFLVSSEPQSLRPPWEVPNFFFGGGGEYFGKLRPEVPKYSMRSSNFFLRGKVILGKLRTEVPKSSIRSSNWGGVFWTKISKPSIRNSNYGGGLFYVVKNTLLCVILTTNFSHWTKPGIADSLQNTTYGD